jgi:hypothetical protein
MIGQCASLINHATGRKLPKNLVWLIRFGENFWLVITAVW